jgi:hypothetical protein
MTGPDADTVAPLLVLHRVCPGVPSILLRSETDDMQ